MEVRSPESLRNSIGQGFGRIPLQDDIYGVIPYGSSIDYQVVTIDPKQKDWFWCYPHPEAISQLGNVRVAVVYSPKMLEYACIPDKATKSIQESGANLILLQGSAPIYPFKADEAYVPILNASIGDGQKLWEYVRRTGEAVKLHVDYPTIKRDKVQVDLWFRSLDDEAFQFLRDFWQYYNVLKDFVQIIPKYKVSF